MLLHGLLVLLVRHEHGLRGHALVLLLGLARLLRSVR